MMARSRRPRPRWRRRSAAGDAADDRAGAAPPPILRAVFFPSPEPRLDVARGDLAFPAANAIEFAFSVILSESFIAPLFDLRGLQHDGGASRDDDPSAEHSGRRAPT